MAIATIDPQPADMMFVTERDWLISDDIRFGDVGRAVQLIPSDSQCGDQEKASKNRRLGKRVHAAVKDLGHRSLPALGPRDHSRTVR